MFGTTCKTQSWDPTSSAGKVSWRANERSSEVRHPSGGLSPAAPQPCWPRLAGLALGVGAGDAGLICGSPPMFSDCPATVPHSTLSQQVLLVRGLKYPRTLVFSAT